MEPLMLHCWVYGTSIETVFPVRILPTETIGILRELIKDKKPVAFQTVDADSLTLYRIQLPQEAEVSQVEGELRRSSLDRGSRLSSLSKVSTCFPQSDGMEWFVIIDAPTSVTAMIQPPVPVLTLNCWVYSTSIETVFPVRILPTETIGILRQLIKEKKPVAFKAVDPENLELYKACIPWNEDFPQILKSQGFQHALLPLQILSDIFSDPNKDDVHIAVKTRLPAPPEVEGEDMLAPLIRSYKRATTTTSKSLTPSQAAKSKGYVSVQSGDQRILDCRYARDHFVNTVAPPIQLFNPAFVFFSSKAFDPAYDVPDDVVRDVRDLMVKFTQIHRREDDRRSHFLSSLEKVIDFALIGVTNDDQTRPDLVVMGLYGVLLSYLVVVEDKNEFGDGGSDPSVQAELSFQRIFCQAKNEQIRLRSCCPAFLIAHAGPWFMIMGGIIAGDCVVQRLTDFLWIPIHSTHDDNQYLRIARVFYALRESIRQLDMWYRDLFNAVEPFDELSPRPHPRFFPFPNTYKDGNKLVRFEYQAPLEHDVSCVTYRAKTVGDDPQDIVVKFVTSYGADAHQEMVLAGFAPKLLYYGEIHVGQEQGMPLFGDLRMVVMEYVDGQTLDKALAQRKIPHSIRSDIRNALQRLHDAGYVYGDLRPPNVMITRKDKVRLIDFDWAGLDGKVKYPVAISTQISWPTGVRGLAPILKEHDNAMLETLLEPS